MFSEILAEQILVEGVARFLGAGVRVGIDQTREQPSFGHQFSDRYRIGGPSITIGVEVDELAVGQGPSAHPENAHRGHSPFSSPRTGWATMS